MAKYMAVDVPRSITVIANDPSGEVCLDYLNANLDAYGLHRPLVSARTAKDFMDAPSALLGWRSQQMLKLLAGAASADAWIVWLDGKNHFLGPLITGLSSRKTVAPGQSTPRRSSVMTVAGWRIA